MKTYKYAIFLRDAESGEVQHGTFEVDSEGFLNFGDLLKKLQESRPHLDFKFKYTLIGVQIISVTGGEVGEVYYKYQFRAKGDIHLVKRKEFRGYGSFKSNEMVLLRDSNGDIIEYDKCGEVL